MVEIDCAYDELINPNKLKLKRHPNNPNKHSKDQIERLCHVIKKNKWRKPIIISNQSGYITAGHGRLEAALKMKLKEVPVNYQDYDSPEQEYQDMTADNAIASWAELDLGQINSDIIDLGPALDLDALGIKDFTLEPLEKFEAGCDEDEVPEHVEPKTKLGDLYKLGEHRLLCGDSSFIDTVEKLMDGQKADLLLTDPPYNSNLDGRHDKVYKGTAGTLDQTEDWDKGFDVVPVLKNALIVTKETANYFVFPGWYPFWHKVFPFFFDLGDNWAVKPFIWCKKFAMSNLRGTSTASATEPCIMAYRKGHDWVAKPGVENYDYALFSSNEGGRGDHPTSKPVALIEHLVTFSKEKSLVLDLFGGSVSTLIACEKTNRKCFMMELDPHYCDVIVARWEKYTGKKAELINGKK